MFHTGDPSALFAVFIGFMLLFVGLAIFLTVFWVLMIVDCVTRKMSDGEKIAWILVLIFLHVIGATVYYFVVKHGKK